MKKLLDFFRKTLYVSPAESRGVIFIFLGMIILIIIPFASDYYFGRLMPGFEAFSPKSLDSLSINLGENPNNNAQSHHQPSTSYITEENDKTPIKYFSFNPNTASVEQLQSLGIPKFLASRIDHYRSKGGKFRKKEDLAKIYDFSPDLYRRLAPYITLASAERASEDSPKGQMIVAATEQPMERGQSYKNVRTEYLPNKPEYTAKNPHKFDLNTADTTEFKNISGIGSGFAKRIIKFRDLLGGFANAEQLRETFGLPPETADELLKYGYVKNNSIKKLKINTIALEQLRHPYLKYFQAKAIIAYREQHGEFKSIEDLKAIKVLDEATINKISPYLDF